MIRLGDRLQDILHLLTRRSHVDVKEDSVAMVVPALLNLPERRVITYLARLSDYDFDAAIRRGKVALLAAALGLNSRAIIKQAREIRTFVSLADMARF